MAKTEVKSEITGAVWKILVKPGDVVGVDEAVIILESMKMEIPVLAIDGGKVTEILVKEGEAVNDGQTVAIVEV
ncbi:MAG: acetyl-CoA carboxylase biotin carboxyl carrier protein subunit [Hyphomicrobium sp.]|nr:acetyl-CoA carboxylase biotin carboxyl carrier protein subunit [Hyphomicrobium sp.]